MFISDFGAKLKGDRNLELIPEYHTEISTVLQHLYSEAKFLNNFHFINWQEPTH